mgnify:CR=1 FL=1
MTMNSRLFTAVAFAALCVCSAPTFPALAAGSGGSAASGTTSAGPSDEYLRAERMVRIGAYREAIDLFREILEDDPGNADVLNYLGYSHRKLGDTEAALEYYLAALKSDPRHVGANEYLGELYLEMGDIGKAEKRLSVLRQSCGSCEEEVELSKKIAALKQRQG